MSQRLAAQPAAGVPRSLLAARRTAHLYIGTAIALKAAGRTDPRLVRLVEAHPELVHFPNGLTLAESNDIAPSLERFTPAEALARCDSADLALMVVDARAARAQATAKRRALDLWRLAALLAPLVFALLCARITAAPARVPLLADELEDGPAPPLILDTLTTCVLTSAPPAPASPSPRARRALSMAA